MEIQSKTSDHLFEKIIAVPLAEENSTKAIATLAEIMRQNGFVTDEFGKAVVDREFLFPTGIPTEVPVALPHADAQYSLRTALAVGVPDKPITFGLMGGDENEKVDVRLIFMLSLPDPKSQIKMIRKMVTLFRNGNIMKRLLSAENPDKLKIMLINYFSESKL